MQFQFFESLHFGLQWNDFEIAMQSTIFLGMPILLKIIFLELTADTKYLFDIFNASFILYKLV